MELKDISRKLVGLRQRAKLTQEALCDDIGISTTTYIKYEKARKIPTVEHLLMIAEYYNVSMDWLLSYSPDGEIQSLSNYREMTELYRYLKAKKIDIQQLIELSKEKTEFMLKYNSLSEQEKKELSLLVDYKLKKGH